MCAHKIEGIYVIRIFSTVFKSWKSLILASCAAKTCLTPEISLWADAFIDSNSAVIVLTTCVCSHRAFPIILIKLSLVALFHRSKLISKRIFRKSFSSAKPIRIPIKSDVFDRGVRIWISRYSPKLYSAWIFRSFIKQFSVTVQSITFGFGFEHNRSSPSNLWPSIWLIFHLPCGISMVQ